METPVVFECKGQQIIGMLHLPKGRGRFPAALLLLQPLHRGQKPRRLRLAIDHGAGSFRSRSGQGRSSGCRVRVGPPGGTPFVACRPAPAFGDTVTHDFPEGIIVDDEQPGRVYVGLQGGDFYASDDAGDSWRPIDLKLQGVENVKLAHA